MDWHISRMWNGIDAEALQDCICQTTPCGMVSSTEADENRCPQHWFFEAHTIRRMHREVDCGAHSG